jgi:hypothetical protein
MPRENLRQRLSMPTLKQASHAGHSYLQYAVVQCIKRAGEDPFSAPLFACKSAICQARISESWLSYQIIWADAIKISAFFNYYQCSVQCLTLPVTQSNDCSIIVSFCDNYDRDRFSQSFAQACS